MSQVYFPKREVKSPKEETIIFQLSHDKVVLDEGHPKAKWDWMKGFQPSGKDIIRCLSLSSFVTVASFLVPQVVKITDLKGLVLGQEFSIRWNLLVSDLEKFNCYPEDLTASEEKCKHRGCLWEVRMRSRLLQ